MNILFIQDIIKNIPELEEISYILKIYMNILFYLMEHM